MYGFSAVELLAIIRPWVGRMAENEEIDLSKARRWQTVVQAVERRESVEEVAWKVRDCLYKTLRSLVKKIPLGQLILAMEAGPSALHRLARECAAGRDYLCRDR